MFQFIVLEKQSGGKGRTGNKIFEYMFWRLIAIHYGKCFSSEFDFPYPFDQLPKNIYFPEKQDLGFMPTK